MIQLILHLIGDYLIQSDWMAQNKKAAGINGLIACFTHCMTYSLPFLFIADVNQVSFIFITHFLIDRWYFIKWFINNTGKKDFGKPPFAPWSIFFIDNTFHLICNYIAINYL